MSIPAHSATTGGNSREPIPLPPLDLPPRQLAIVQELAQAGGVAHVPLRHRAVAIYALERRGLIELVRRERVTGGGAYRHFYALKLAMIVQVAQGGKNGKGAECS